MIRRSFIGSLVALFSAPRIAEPASIDSTAPIGTHVVYVIGAPFGDDSPRTRIRRAEDLIK